MTDTQKLEYELMKILEGCESTSYVCTSGKVSVGVGFNMQQVAAEVIWNELGIKEDFNDVYQGVQEISDDTSFKLFEYFWENICEGAVILRCAELELDYHSMPDWKKFILKDIVYNVGSIKKWRKVLVETTPNKVLYEARRRPHKLMDSRVAKIAKFYGFIDTVEDAKELGLIYAKYVQ